MLKQTLKVTAFLAGSAVVLPYAVALLANVLMGWPQKNNKNNYKRALSPGKVYSLNYAVILQLLKIRYLGLKIRWMQFYADASRKRLIKDITYGTRQNSLDLYYPLNNVGQRLDGSQSVVVFLYGGTWSSGDKNMYGLLCSQLADQLRAVVCCPNYSLYPKGFVDDMAQDVVDCLNWIQQHAQLYAMNKDHVIMIGHSAGGHLALLSVIELVRKGLIHNPEALIMSQQEVDMVTSHHLSRQSSNFSQSLRFEEGHFRVSESEEEVCEGEEAQGDLGTSSFYMVGKKGMSDHLSTASLEVQRGSDAFFMVEQESRASASDEGSLDIEKVEKLEDSAKEEAEQTQAVSLDEPDTAADEGDVEEEMENAGIVLGGSDDGIVMESESEQKEEGVAPDSMGGDEPEPAIGPEIRVTEEHPVVQFASPGSLASIKLIIGLAGVYDITDHFEFESWRGIEDISSMARAMYGPRHFERLSPTQIIKDLPPNTRVPPMLFIHGSDDDVVPESSSHLCGQALWEMGSRSVEYLVIPKCGHYEICLDLMDPSRDWYSAVMGEIKRAANFYI